MEKPRLAGICWLIDTYSLIKGIWLPTGVRLLDTIILRQPQGDGRTRPCRTIPVAIFLYPLTCRAMALNAVVSLAKPATDVTHRLALGHVAARAGMDRCVFWRSCSTEALLVTGCPPRPAYTRRGQTPATPTNCETKGDSCTPKAVGLTF